LPPEAGLDVQIVCAGTNGAVALEDVYVAGRICSELCGSRTDAARVAQRVARSFQAPIEALAASADAAVLRQAGLTGDIAVCALESDLDTVPVVVAAGVSVAAVAALADPAQARGFETSATVTV
jgi:phosphosulfolactate phosphohydrolase-like enzyme